MNWNGTYWGLVRHIGPWKDTPEDQRRANSRSGGPHAGHGNWMQTFNPSRNGDGDARVYQPERAYSYADGAIPVVKFDVLGEAIAKVPGSRIGFGAKKKIGDRSLNVRKFTNNVVSVPGHGPLQNYKGDEGFPKREMNLDTGEGVPVHMRDWTPQPHDRSRSVKPDLNLQSDRRNSIFQEHPPGVVNEALHAMGNAERLVAKARGIRARYQRFLSRDTGTKRKRPSTPSGSKKVKTEGFPGQPGDYASAA